MHACLHLCVIPHDVGTPVMRLLVRLSEANAVNSDQLLGIVPV